MNEECLPGNNYSLEGYSNEVSTTLKQERGVNTEMNASIKNHGKY